MTFHHEFEWDLVKAAANLRKHKVSFHDAAAILADEEAEVFHVEYFDDANSTDEERWITTGSHPARRLIVLRIAWTMRGHSGDTRVTRIISARPVTVRERIEYENEIA